jgi:chromosome segregation ATPase
MGEVEKREELEYHRERRI